MASGAFLFKSDYAPVQLYVFLLLVAVLPGYLKIFICTAAPPSDEPSKLGLVQLAIDIFGLVVCLVCRFWIGLPLGYECTQHGFEAVGFWGGLWFGSVLLGLAPLFFVINLVMLLPLTLATAKRQLMPKSE